jgi:hypothetical protein
MPANQWWERASTLKLNHRDLNRYVIGHRGDFRGGQHRNFPRWRNELERKLVTNELFSCLGNPRHSSHGNKSVAEFVRKRYPTVRMGKRGIDHDATRRLEEQPLERVAQSRIDDADSDAIGNSRDVHARGVRPLDSQLVCELDKSTIDPSSVGLLRAPRLS